MKRLMLIAAASLGVASLQAYVVTIENTTDKTFTMDIHYGGGGVCSPDTWTIPPKEPVEKNVGLCCAGWPVTFAAQASPKVYPRNETRKIEGTNKREPIFEFYPPRTGMGLSCRSWKAVIKEIDVAEKGQPSVKKFIVEQG